MQSCPKSGWRILSGFVSSRYLYWNAIIEGDDPSPPVDNPEDEKGSGVLGVPHSEPEVLTGGVKQGYPTIFEPSSESQDHALEAWCNVSLLASLEYFSRLSPKP